MSVTFFANFIPEINDDSLYDLDNERIFKDRDAIHKIIHEKFKDDIGFYFYEFIKKNGPQPISFWENQFKIFGTPEIKLDKWKLLINIYRDNEIAMTFYLSAIDPEKKSKEVQMSNANAMAVLQLLGLDNEDLSGKINPLSLLKKIERVKNSRIIDEFTRSSYQEGNIYDMGINRRYFDKKLMNLEELAYYCIMKECDIVWG